MSLAQNIVASRQSHLAALRTKHSALAEQIEQEQLAPWVNEITVKALKLEKLKLKEEITRTEDILH